MLHGEYYNLVSGYALKRCKEVNFRRVVFMKQLFQRQVFLHLVAACMLLSVARAGVHNHGLCEHEHRHKHCVACTLALVSKAFIAPAVIVPVPDLATRHSPAPHVPRQFSPFIRHHDPRAPPLFGVNRGR